MKKIPAFFLMVLCLVLSREVHADLFGSSGGIKNESDVAVKVWLIRESGDYETQVVAANASLDFPENTVKIRIGASVADPPLARSRIRVAVIQPDGSRHELTGLESEMAIVQTGKFSKPYSRETQNSPAGVP